MAAAMSGFVRFSAVKRLVSHGLGTDGRCYPLTGEDWAVDGLGTLDPEVMAEDMGGPKGYRTKRPPLAQGRVRYVGERVAVVIAGDRSAGAGCGGAGLGRLRSTARSGARRGRSPPRHAIGPRRRRRQHLLHDAHGQ